MTIAETVEERIARIHEVTGIPAAILTAAIEAPTVQIYSCLRLRDTDPDGGYDTVWLSPDHRCSLQQYVALLGDPIQVSGAPYGQVVGSYHYVYDTYAWVKLANRCEKTIEHWDTYDYARVLRAVYYPDGSAKVYRVGRVGVLNNPAHAHEYSFNPASVRAGRITSNDQIIFLCRTACGRIGFEMAWAGRPFSRDGLIPRLPRMSIEADVNPTEFGKRARKEAARKLLSVELTGIKQEQLLPTGRYHPDAPDQAYLYLFDGVTLPKGAKTTHRVKEPGLVWLSARQYSQLGIPDAITCQGLYRLSQRRR